MSKRSSNISIKPLTGTSISFSYHLINLPEEIDLDYSGHGSGLHWAIPLIIWIYITLNFMPHTHEGFSL